MIKIAAMEIYGYYYKSQYNITCIEVPATSYRVFCTVKTWLAEFQNTFGLLLEHTLRPQVGGLVVPEKVSPKAGIVVGAEFESMVRFGKVGTIIVVDEQP
jgi:hypothetical protein